jgi:hypothetical protein
MVRLGMRQAGAIARLVSRLAYLAFLFPGVVTHEFAHYYMCRVFDVPVEEAVFFQFGTPPGYIKHRDPHSILKGALIGLAPFIINICLGATLFLVANSLVKSNSHPLVLAGVLWLGWAAILHSFPSVEDFENVWSRVKTNPPLWPLLPIAFPVHLAIILVNSFSAYFVTGPLALFIFLKCLRVTNTTIPDIVTALV